jgi:GNAT superfamily N-acetyltransferase
MNPRPAVPAEADRLSALMRRLFLAAYRDCSSERNVQAFLDTVYTPARQLAELKDPAIHTCVLEDGDHWAGFAQLRLAARRPDCVPLANGAELGRIYLDPAYQGRALGATLHEHIAGIARDHGRDGLWLNVWQLAPKAVAFYERQGFRIVGTTDFIVGDDAKTDWLMYRRFA